MQTLFNARVYHYNNYHHSRPPPPLWCNNPKRSWASSFLRFLNHSQLHITVGWTPLEDWSARRRDLYLTTHNTHNRQTAMPQRDSKPQSQQASGRRPPPSTARPLKSAQELADFPLKGLYLVHYNFDWTLYYYFIFILDFNRLQTYFVHERVLMIIYWRFWLVKKSVRTECNHLTVRTTTASINHAIQNVIIDPGWECVVIRLPTVQEIVFLLPARPRNFIFVASVHKNSAAQKVISSVRIAEIFSHENGRSANLPTHLIHCRIKN